MAAEDELNTHTTTTTSIYKACRRIKRRENSICNSLRSIYENSIFVAEVAQLWPELPLLANLRCGLWYSSKFYSNCYFKSTDGHTNNLSFSRARLNLHVAELAVEHLLKDVDAVLNCDTGLTSTSMNKDNYLHLPIVNSKLDRFSLLNHMPSAFDFAKLLLNRGKKLLICSWNGEDISVCVCLAILTSLYNEAGFFDSGKAFMESSIAKQDLKRRLVFICKYSPSARPSRGNLKQVFSYLSSRQELATSLNFAIDIVALQKTDDSLS